MSCKLIPQFVVTVLWTVSVISEPISNTSRPNVAVVYETYCPDSAKFITKQFYPWYKSLNAEDITLDLNPAGNTTPSPGLNLTFNCEHGPKECSANRIHACVLNATSLSLDKKIAFVNCSMALVNLTSSDPNPIYPFDECASAAGFDAQHIGTCLNTSLGNEVLKNYSDKIKPLGSISIPSVIMNGEYNASFSKIAVENLTSSMCEWVKLKNDSRGILCKENGNNSASTFGITLPIVIITLLIVKIFQ